MLKQRLLTALCAIPILLAAIFSPYIFIFKILVLICLGFGIYEFLTVVQIPKKDILILFFAGLLHVFYLLFIPVMMRRDIIEFSFLLIIIFCFYVMKPKENLEGIGAQIALAFIGIHYVGTLGSFIGQMRDLPLGPYWILTTMALAWMNDTCAYFAGLKFGKHKLATLISPKKSWEGFIGGYCGSLLGFLIFWFLFHQPIPLARGLLLVLCAGVLGPVGDLAESLFKRTFHIKDSGAIIPGHGGMLDRIDALLFVAPVVYFLAVL